MTTTKSRNLFKVLAVAILLSFVAMAFMACNGKESDPNAIKISNYDEFKEFIQEFTTSDYLDLEIANEGKYVLLTGDIDCQNEVLTPLLTKDYYGLEFKIDGNGHSISNFVLDNSCIREVSTAAGTAGAAFRVLSLFPRSDGGQLVDIEFKNVNIIVSPDDDQLTTDVDPGMPWGGTYGMKVGIVGYSKSTGANESAESNNSTSVYQNVKLTNINVNVKNHAATASVSEFPFSIGALIGLDADTTNYGENLQATSSMAIRQNITVDNFNVTVDMPGGAVLVGGVVGQSNWQRVTYDNCVVQNSTFKVINNGATAGTYDRENANVKLNDSVSLGGIVGGSVKPQHEIIVKNCTTDVDYIVESGNADNNVNAGTMIGLVVESNSTDTDHHILDLDENNKSTSTCVKGAVGATGTAVENIPVYQTK